MHQPEGSSSRDASFWAEVEAAFSASVDLADGPRRSFLERQYADRPDIRAEVESLVAAHQRAQHFMQHPTMPADPAVVAPLLTGDVVGQFRLTDVIASGGMATVYRAERADDAFRQQVAVKVISLPLTDEGVQARFLAERQILASLNHPHIVSLLDAGLTERGNAYLIMELVEGVPITTYCRDRALAVTDRLRLFQQVCDAVQYAHAHFVVHRDLKPANVLVTADGVPKVLDFGIATLFEGPLATPDRAPGTQPGTEPLTPNYASPEQLRGERLTVASDVYALGMLLFELITGMRPYEVGGESREEAIRIVCDTPTIRPSDATPGAGERPPYDWRRLLRGDLDAITLRACHRRPGQRYASADALSQDIGRHLWLTPVEARKATLGYVVGRLAMRHRFAFASAMLSSLLVVGALAVALWQGHAARVERERAVKRFDDVRALANTVIFKIHDAIAPLPGSTPVRQTIVTEGLTYLERLSADAAGDPGLQLELGRAYLKIGEVQGRPNTANLGDRQGAIASFRKAKALLAPLAQRPGATADVFSSYLSAMRFLSETLSLTEGAHRDESIAEAIAAVDAAKQFAATHQALDQSKSFVGAAEFALAQQYRGQEARLHWQKAGAAYEELLANAPDDPMWQRNVALVEKYVGGTFDHDMDYSASLVHHQRALELDQKRYERTPDNRVVQLDVAIDLGNVAYCQWRQGQIPEAISLYSRSLAMRERLMASDPQDALSREKVAFIHRQLGGLYEDQHEAALALSHYRLAVEGYQMPKTKTAEGTLQNADAWMGIARLERQRPAISCDAYRHAFDLLRGATETARRRKADGGYDPMPGVASAAARCGLAEAARWINEPLRDVNR